MLRQLLPHLLRIRSHSLAHLSRYLLIHPSAYSTPLLVARALLLYLACPTLLRAVVAYTSPQLEAAIPIDEPFACRALMAVFCRVVSEVFFSERYPLLIGRCL